MKFAFIAAEKAWAPISVLCKVLDVSRSGFYAWDERGRSSRSTSRESSASLEISLVRAGSGAGAGADAATKRASMRV